MGALPPIIGNVDAMRKQIPKRIRAGEDLLSRLKAAEDVMATIPEREKGQRISLADFDRIQVINDQVEPVKRSMVTWSRTNQRIIRNCFGAQADKIYGVSPAPPIPQRWIDDQFIPAVKASIEVRLAELQKISGEISSTPVRLAKTPDVDLDFVRSAHIVDGAVVDRLEERMRNLKDRRNVSRVIAGAKELVEAVSHGALHALGAAPQKGGDFLVLTKRTRQELTSKMVVKWPDAAGLEATTSKLLGGFNTIEQALTEMRNAHGEGHGRRTAPKGLEVRHGRLAVDAALGYCHFVTRALDDLGLV